MPDIMHYITIKAPPDQIYRALTDAEGIRNWWTRDADLASSVGGEGDFRFGSYGGGQATKVRVEQLLPAQRVVWRTVASFRPEWIGTTIEFDLQATPEGTVLRFAHRGFQQADDTYALCTTGWGYYLVSLQQYMQTGKGAPSPDIDFARVVQ